MSSIQDTGPASNLFTSYNTKTTAKPAAEDPQDRFLKLLVTQMKNQDPLNPLDNAQVTTQLAQISTVNGIEKLNATLQGMASGITAGQSLQAANMIGHNVLVPGSALQLAGGSGVFGVDLAQPADSVKVTIQDSTGQAVRVMDLGALAAGPLALQWDGMSDNGTPAADGGYTMSISAQRGDQKVDAQTLAFGTVQGVSQGSQGVQLNVGALGTANLADIKQIF
ncbi:flagellar hook assembly protein FlgD [Nitrosospira sp. NpAV]|uniref:flagellar hook assembly protein FlgD n=1 Tax=Nitrosospira sp. NpAV TaxID=58133 RepID=UPI0005A03514|nr:flagellar hook assembly protein FlgD [Nitrosospira sp. NpAV]KIO49102.1 flagellar basal body rod modification protein FlgD [Nitrosospira sp. NpAV]